MNNLSNSILDYYLSHFDELQPDKQGHFATRLHLWCQDPQVAGHIAALRPWFTAGEQPKAALQQLIALSQETAGHGSKNAGELRQTYFVRYPLLKPVVLVLFRINFLQTVYGVDCRELFYQLFAQKDVLRLRDDLLKDTEALSILSTHAINFLYLLERCINQRDDTLPLAHFLEVGKTAYNRSDKLHLQLLIYLYTHCIIGDARFYYRALPARHAPVYTAMLQELEALIGQHYEDINLDNKFEFLVCCKIAGFTSGHEERIFDEASRSQSPDGVFLVDRFNNNPQAGNISLDTSEHRNVLFIMANRDFTPLG